MDEVTRITSPILITGKNRGKQIDYRYGPYNGLDDAYSNLGPNGLDCIFEGLTIGIINPISKEVKEYWFIGGTNRENLIEKIQDNNLTWN